MSLATSAGQAGDRVRGLLPSFAAGFGEIKRLLLPHGITTRSEWMAGLGLDSLVRTFEDLLTAAGVTTYGDGSTAALGSYGSLYDFVAAKVVVAEFTDDELSALGLYYEQVTYLSPIYGLVKASCREELNRRARSGTNSARAIVAHVASSA